MSNAKQDDPHSVIVEGRLSYPNLFHKKQRKNTKGESTGRAVFAACLLIPKLKDGKPNPDLDKVRKAAQFTKQEKWLGKPVNFTGSCLRDGVEKEATDGYGPTIMFISASSDRPIGVVDRNLSELKEEDGKIYAGCWVRMGVRCWAQDNENGKRLNWALQNVQFVRNDEPFGDRRLKAEEQFDALPESDENADSTTSGENDGI